LSREEKGRECTEASQKMGLTEMRTEVLVEKGCPVTTKDKEGKLVGEEQWGRLRPQSRGTQQRPPC